MQLPSLLLLAIASIVSAHPRPIPQGTTPLLPPEREGPWTHVGSAYAGGQTAALGITGGCVSGYYGSTEVAYDQGVRCRFYRDHGCNEQIGFDEGLLGQGRETRMPTSEPFSGATCWYA